MIKQLTSVFFGILLFIAAIVFFSSAYIVDETKQVFVTQFGKIVRGPINGPDKNEDGPDKDKAAGLYFRLPFIQEVHSFEKRYLEWDGAPNQVTTKDKLFIFIDTYARWRIVDAKLFSKKSATRLVVSSGSTTFLTARLGLLSPRTISSRSSARGNARPLSMRPRCSVTNPS